MSLTVTPEAQSIYDTTLRRASGRYIFGWEWTSEAEARQQIEDTFFAAVSVTEVSEGRELGENRQLDLTEARLAAAALNLAAGGDVRVASDEASTAYRYLSDTLGEMYRAPIYGSSYSEWLIHKSAGRARGWRHIRASTVEREIRALFRSTAAQGLDAREGTDAADALLVALSLNYYAGGNGENIEIGDVWSAGSGLEMALRNL